MTSTVAGVETAGRGRSRPSTAPIVAVLVVAVLLGAAAVLGVHAARMVLALAVCLVLPGLGWGRRMYGRDLGDRIAMTVVLSICATVVVATTMAVAGRWSTAGGTAVLLLVAVLGLLPDRVVAPLRSALAPDPRHAAVGDQDWADWYSEARRRIESDRRESESRWIEWYAGGDAGRGSAGQGNAGWGSAGQGNAGWGSAGWGEAEQGGAGQDERR